MTESGPNLGGRNRRLLKEVVRIVEITRGQRAVKSATREDELLQVGVGEPPLRGHAEDRRFPFEKGLWPENKKTRRRY